MLFEVFHRPQINSVDDVVMGQQERIPHISGNRRCEISPDKSLDDVAITSMDHILVVLQNDIDGLWKQFQNCVEAGIKVVEISVIPALILMPLAS